MIEIAAAITSLTTTWNLLKAAIDARDEHKIKEAMTSMLTSLLDAQGRAFGLSEELAQLQTKMRDLESERNRLLSKLQTRGEYRLFNIYKGDGAFFVYRYAGDAEAAQSIGDTEHYLCQPCFDSGKKSVLTIDGALVRCLLCGTKVIIDPALVSENLGRLGRTMSR